ncbi:MAG: TatD family hydrolase [Thiohalomonadales bacterium]
MELIDTHCHLDVDAFVQDRENVLEHCRQLHIRKIVVPAIQSKTWDTLLQVCDLHAGLYPTLGLHPMFIEQHQNQDLIHLENYIIKYHPCAVGEIGLDYYKKETVNCANREKQIQFYSAQLDIAKRHGLPVILHVRRAHQQVLTLLKQKKVTAGIVHAFSGSREEAQRYIDIGFKLGFGGSITYPRAKRLRRLASELPLSSIVLETDAPDMTGFKHHGQRNSPEYLPECLQTLSNLRKQSVEEIAAQTTRNAQEILKLS